MEVIQIHSTTRESKPGPKSLKSNRTIDIGKVIDFLVIFSIIWFLEGKVWKASKAFLSAGRLYLERIRYDQRAVLLSQPMDHAVFENEYEFAKLARPLFRDISKFQFHPFVQQTVNEMEKDANSLFSFNLLNKRRNDVAGTTRH